MKNAMTALMLVTTLTACGQELVKTVDLADQKPLVDRFVEEAAVRGQTIVIRDLVIEYATLEERTLGECQRRNGHMVITLNSQYWDQRTDEQKEQTMFHELAHCVLLIGHDDSYSNLMMSRALHTDYYTANRESLLNDLFSR